MIGKNKRVIASILSLAVMASALPMSSVWAADDINTPALTETQEDNMISIKDITLNQILYIDADNAIVEDGKQVSNWNLNAADYIEKMEAAGFSKTIDKADFQEIINMIGGSYGELLGSVVENVTGQIVLENGVFKITGEVTELNKVVADKINEKINEAMGDVSDEEFKVDINTNLDMNLAINIDTNVLADKMVKIDLAVSCDGQSYKAFEMFGLGTDKLTAIETEVATQCDAKIAEKQAELDAKKAELDSFAGDRKSVV